MKTILWCSTVFPVSPEERRRKRPIGRDPVAYGQMLEGLGRHAVWADELGFDAFGSTEHHFQVEGGESIPNNLLLYAKLACLTERIKFIPMSVVLTARDPLRVAEDLALFDQMFPGRVGVCFARGYQSRWMQTLSQREGVSAGKDPESDARNREIFNEHLEVVERAWAEDTFSYAGKNYQVPYPASGIPNWRAAPWTREFGDPGDVDDEGTVRRVGVIPKPTAPLEIFVPNTMSDATVIEAARAGRSVIREISNRDGFRAAAELYRREARAAGRDLALGEGFGAVAKVALGDSFEEAFELAAATVGYWFRHFFGLFGINEGLRVESDPPGRLAFADDRELARRMYERGALLCGTPDEVSEQLSELSRCFADGRLEWFGWEFWAQALPGGPEVVDLQRRQMELFANQVMPRFS
jgi:alkanesulfonate monooxygenase SsuD/methylene tetrahydromethanopterin reductase-like flavin-dependent oxidoreductase (luciferase family)